MLCKEIEQMTKYKSEINRYIILFCKLRNRDVDDLLNKDGKGYKSLNDDRKILMYLLREQFNVKPKKMGELFNIKLEANVYDNLKKAKTKIEEDEVFEATVTNIRNEILNMSFG